jgi:hypothetical protein
MFTDVRTLNQSLISAATGEKKAKMMGGLGLGLGLTQDALSKVRLRKSPANGGGGNNVPRPEKPAEPSELGKRVR